MIKCIKKCKNKILTLSSSFVYLEQEPMDVDKKSDEGYISTTLISISEMWAITSTIPQSD